MPPDLEQAHGLYASFGTVLLLVALTAPAALAMRGYAAVVRGVPDSVFFPCFVLALDQGIE